MVKNYYFNNNFFPTPHLFSLFLSHSLIQNFKINRTLEKEMEIWGEREI